MKSFNWTKIFKRRQYLINKKFQLTFVGHFLLMSTINTIVFWGAVVIFFAKIYALGNELNLPANHIYFQFFREQEGVMNSIFAWSSVIMISVLTLGGILLSHKVAGPLYRLRMHLKECKEHRHLKKLSFRKGDFFQDIPQEFNKMIEKQNP